MKVALISDIHGNYPALQAVLEDIKHMGADTIYCLGDLVGYYCMINEVIDTVRQLNIKTILGNHDAALVHHHGVIERSKTCTKILKEQLTYITEDNLAFLQSLPTDRQFHFEDKRFFCVHGGLADPVDEYIHNLDEAYFRKFGFNYDVLVSGHTHVPRNEKHGPYHYLNPASVGQPRDGNPAASYLLLSPGNYEHRRVPYDVDAIVAKMKALQYDPYIYEILYKGKKIGG